MKYKTINDLDLRGKRVLLRIDINSGVIGKKVQDSPRFKEHSKTIKELLNKKAVVVILAHQGRPGKNNFTSLKQHSKILNKYVKVKFVNETIGKKALKEIEKLKGGEALLLENVRFLKEEFTPGNNNLVKILSKKFDYYINDAFSIMHRNQTSVVSFPKVLESAIGRSVENELRNIENLKSRLKDSLFILGGYKTSDLILLIKHPKILSTGTFCLLSLISKGYDLGKENEMLKKDANLVSIIKKNSRGIRNPIDLAYKSKGKRKEIDLKDLPIDSPILDIGKKTIKEYIKEINKAKSIFFKGSVGYYEDSQFALGTKEILKAIAKRSVFSVIAGGGNSRAIKKFKINKNSFSHVSLSGGALVYYLSGKKLPGLEAIK